MSVGAGTGRGEPSSVCFLGRFGSKVTRRADIQLSLTFLKQSQHQNQTPAWKGILGTIVAYSVRNATSSTLGPQNKRLHEKKHSQWKSMTERKWS